MNKINNATRDVTEEVNQRTIAAVERANAMPFLKIQHFEDAFEEGIVDFMPLSTLSVELSHGQIYVSPWNMDDVGRKDLYCGAEGTHPQYGNFVKLWSVRGPGDGPRQRPMFLFHDNEPVFL